MNFFIQGILAGYGIAIPVGAIAILIVETGLRRGFRAGFAAGAGAATADVFYAALAALAGQALARALAPAASILRAASAVTLIGLGVWGIWTLLRARSRAAAPTADSISRPIHIYTKFVGLTALNPLTVAYFAALILGNSAAMPGWSARAEFVAGAGLASLSWQSLLAGLGALAHRRLSPRFQLAASLAGNLVVVTLGLLMFFRPAG